VCDLETSRMGAPYIYIYDISRLRVKCYVICLSVFVGYLSGTQIASFLRHIKLSPVARLAVPYFSHVIS